MNRENDIEEEREIEERYRESETEAMGQKHIETEIHNTEIQRRTKTETQRNRDTTQYRNIDKEGARSRLRDRKRARDRDIHTYIDTYTHT